MSRSEDKIVCRRCRNTIPIEAGSCPHCGASIRSYLSLVGAAIFGGLLAGTSLFRLSELWFFGLVGLALLGGAGYLLYDKRHRVHQAAEQGEDSGADVNQSE